MAEVKGKVDKALNESRMLVLGTQVLVGAQFFAAFASSFDKLPRFSQYLAICAVAPLVLAMVAFMAPVPYHQLVARGESTEAFHRFITRVIGLALLPFALGLAADLYIPVAKIGGVGWGWLAGLGGMALALFLWYGLELLRREHDRHEHEGARREDGARPDGAAREGGTGDEKGTPLPDRVREVLTEARVVLPGVQALLGFQFDAVLTEAFDKLPASSRYLHVGSLIAIAVSMVLLMTPAAYHRLVERGEDTEHFQRFASRMVLASMVPFALGVAGDFFVVVRKVTESTAFAAVGAVLLLALCYGLWFGFTLALRRREAPGIHS